VLQSQKILVAGATGQVALPVTMAMADGNDVWATARFSDPEARNKLERAGVRCVALDLVGGELKELPSDFDYVLNFSVMRTNNWGNDLDGNAGGTGELMFHCRSARAFLHCSSTAVYQPDDHRAFLETDALGDNHRVWEFISTYSICKIAAEAMARFCAHHLGLPTTITRLNVPYGDNGGWPAAHLDMMVAGMAIPVHTDAPSVFNPIHSDDIIAAIPAMLDAASVPATVVNWGGDDPVSIEDWCTYLGELTGLEPKFELTDKTIESVSVDLTKMHELAGPTTVPWHDGFRRMVAARHPELLS
jgi:nucleoside-diphosphate-sugar epimerase